MSYILDALRKSDQQRQRGTTPTLMSVHASTHDDTSPPGLLAYALIAAVMAASGILVGWMHPWRGAPHPPPAEAVGKSIAVPAVEPRLQAAVPGPLADLPRPRVPAAADPVQPRPEQKSATSSVAAKQNVPHASPASPPGLASTPPLPPAVRKELAPAPERPVEPLPAEAAQQSGVMTLAELPPSIRQEIPSLTVQLHAYSETPAERMVGINDQLLKEGDVLAPGLRLEQITPDGVIFGYKQYLFRRGVQ